MPRKWNVAFNWCGCRSHDSNLPAEFFSSTTSTRNANPNNTSLLSQTCQNPNQAPKPRTNSFLPPQSTALLHACRVHLRREAAQLRFADSLTIVRTHTLTNFTSDLQSLMDVAMLGPEAGSEKAMPDLEAISEVSAVVWNLLLNSPVWKRISSMMCWMHEVKSVAD